MKISTLKTQKPKSSASNKTQAAKTPENKAADKTSTSAAKVGAPTVANSPARTYIDTFNTSPDCESNKKKIEEKCKPEPEQTEADKKKGAPKRKGMMAAVANASHKLDALGRLGYKRNDANAWVDTHCDLMWTKPMALSKVENFSKTMTESLEKLKSEKFTLAKNALSELGEVAIDKAGSAATKKLIGLGARSLAKNVVGGAAVVGTLGTVGDFVEAGMLAWTATDIVSTATELAAMAGPEGAAMLANLKDSLNIKEKVASILADLEKHPEKALADSMEFAGKLNSCLRAKRCQLVPMKETSAKKAKEKGQGCCPGQTGHHLLPREMFKRKIDEDIPGQFLKNGKPKTKSVDDPSNCKAYTNAVHNNAPVVCVEGTNGSTASHGTIHGKMDGLMTEHRKAHGDKITNDEAMEAAVKSHQETFKTGCDHKCLKAQLKSYYDKLCDGQMKPRGGKGTDVVDNEAGNDLGKDTD